MTAPSGDGLDALRPSPEREAEIRASLATYNDSRPAEHRRYLVNAWGGTGAFALLVLGIAATLWRSDPRGDALPIVLVGGFFLVPLLWGLLSKPAREFQQTLRRRVLPVAFGFVEDLRYRHADPSSPATDRLKETRLIPFTRAEIDDSLTGRVEGFPFQFVEAKLTSGSGKHKQTHFAGLIFHFERDEGFKGRIFVSTRPNAVARFFRDMFGSSLTVLDRGEGSRHEYRTDNSGSARALIGETLDKAVDWLDRSWTEGPAQLVLSGRDCFVLLPTSRNWFELPGLDQDIDYGRHIEPMVWELARLLAIAKLVRQV